MTLQKNHIQSSQETPLLSPTISPQTYLEISTSAFNHNIAYYKNKIGRHNKLAIVIKGNGYGHGLHQIGSLCEQNEHIDVICVAQLSEALALQNVTKPILVLGYSDVSPELAVNKNIHCMVDSIEYAQQLNTIGKKHNRLFNVHVKIDTGLSRMGIDTAQAHQFIEQLQQLDHIAIYGIYSHFAASDSNPLFTAYQFDQFNALITQLKAMNVCPPFIHMGNSASTTTVSYPEYFNFFRIGIGTYGLGMDNEHLKPVMTWKTHIAHIKTVPKGSYIGYTGSYQVQRESRIALLPVGYYDGYKFRFSNKTTVMINGSYAPVIGRIAMNMTIIDVTDIKAATGDEVTLMGSDEKIHAHTLGALGEIKNVREIITGINPMITRIIAP